MSLRLWKGRWRWLAAFVGAAGVAGALGWLVWFSSLLAVERIEVVGPGQWLTGPEVVEASGVRVGTPLARVDVGAVRDRVRSLRPVESVRVRRSWPGTLRIRVREREPVAAIADSEGYLLLDAESVHVATVDERPDGIPLIRLRGPPAGASDPAGDSGPHVERAPAALRVLVVLPERLTSKVRTIAVADGGAVTLRLQGGARVLWGSPENADHGREKSRLLSALLQRHDAAMYDVRSPEVVTVR